MKRTLGNTQLLKNAAKEANSKKIDLSSTVLMSPSQLNKEKRTEAKMIYLTPSEYNNFISLIGRETFSNAARKLIIKFIEDKLSK